MGDQLAWERRNPLRVWLKSNTKATEPLTQSDLYVPPLLVLSIFHSLGLHDLRTAALNGPALNQRADLSQEFGLSHVVRALDSPRRLPRKVRKYATPISPLIPG